MKLSEAELKKFLEEKVWAYNQPAFIESDPISIPHRYTKKEDIEISAFLSAIISWGNRKAIVANAWRLMQVMDNSPHDFILSHSATDLFQLKKFVHRTFNGSDAVYFICSLRNIYHNHGGLSEVFGNAVPQEDSMAHRIHHFKKIFYSLPGARTEKHLPDPLENSAAKRINMFLRWMVRKDKGGVDFGIWHFISPPELFIPLDVHTGNIARKLGLLKRKQNDWKAVAELTSRLRTFDAADPVKYDFALFGLGMFEKF